MKLISFKRVCRSCLFHDASENLITVDGPTDEFYENGILKPEYEFARWIENFCLETNQPCERCGSFNMDIFGVKFDGKVVLVGPNGPQIHVIIFTEEDGMIRVKTDGSQFLPVDPGVFWKMAFETMENAIHQVDSSLFEEHERGKVRLIVTARKCEVSNTSPYGLYPRLEQFRFIGFSKQDVIQYFNHVKKNHKGL